MRAKFASVSTLSGIVSVLLRNTCTILKNDWNQLTLPSRNTAAAPWAGGTGTSSDSTGFCAWSIFTRQALGRLQGERICRGSSLIIACRSVVDDCVQTDVPPAQISPGDTFISRLRLFPLKPPPVPQLQHQMWLPPIWIWLLWRSRLFRPRIPDRKRLFAVSFRHEVLLVKRFTVGSRGSRWFQVCVHGKPPAFFFPLLLSRHTGLDCTYKTANTLHKAKAVLRYTVASVCLLHSRKGKYWTLALRVWSEPDDFLLVFRRLQLLLQRKPLLQAGRQQLEDCQVGGNHKGLARLLSVHVFTTDSSLKMTTGLTRTLLKNCTLLAVTAVRGVL